MEIRVNMNEKELLDCFSDLNHKFLIITNLSNFNVCGKTITNFKIENGLFTLHTKCEDLQFFLDEIQGVQIL